MRSVDWMRCSRACVALLPQMLQWLDAKDGCFDWGKCIRYLCEAVNPVLDPAQVVAAVRQAVTYVGPVDLFDEHMHATMELMRPMKASAAPQGPSSAVCRVCGCRTEPLAAHDGSATSLPASGGSSDNVGAGACSSSPASVHAADDGSGAGAGGGDACSARSGNASHRLGAGGAGAGRADAAEATPTAQWTMCTHCTRPLPSNGSRAANSVGVWRAARGGSPQRLGSLPPISVVSLHSVVECISDSPAQFSSVFDNALRLVCSSPACLLIMTVNTNTTEWSGGKGQVFAAANVNADHVTRHLERRGFSDIHVVPHFGDTDTEMAETIGVTALWIEEASRTTTPT